MPAYGRFGFQVFDQKLNLVFVPHRAKKSDELYFCVGFVPEHIGNSLIPETYMRERQRGHSIAVLAAGIAHNFNNLFTGILGNLSLAQNREEGSEARMEAMSSAEQAAMRARDLTHQLLSFAKGGAPVKERASMAELLREATSFLLCGGRGNVRWIFSMIYGPCMLMKGELAKCLAIS